MQRFKVFFRTGDKTNFVWSASNGQFGEMLAKGQRERLNRLGYAAVLIPVTPDNTFAVPNRYTWEGISEPPEGVELR